jgi:hypothetical protein
MASSEDSSSIRPRAQPKPPLGRRVPASWSRLDDERLLDLRFCDLGLTIKGSALEARVEQLYAELAERHIRLRPHCWLGEEWFSPDGVPGIAIPFYLAHPRLRKLEDRLMLHVEGGTRQTCMRILRHEAGHTLDTAFRLHRRANWQRVFGKASKAYPDFYEPKPFSRNYVLHLNSWYAQSHPAEDFAETFAVWLAPGSRWRSRYKQWPAIKKLQFVDELMGQIAGRGPLVRSRRRVEPLSESRKTLREHYQAKQARYSEEHPEHYDRHLRRLFSSNHRAASEPAAAFLRRARAEIRRAVAERTGEHPYTVEQVLDEMIARCRQLELQTDLGREQVKRDSAASLAIQTLNDLHSGHHRFAL